MAPINQWRHTFSRIRYAIVVGVDHAIAAINFECGSDQDDYIFADGLNEWRLLNRQTIGEFHQHLGRAGLS